MIGNSRWRQAFLGAALASFGAIAHGQDSSASTVYRCHGADGAIEYRVYPGKGGAGVDMMPGEGGPAGSAAVPCVDCMAQACNNVADTCNYAKPSA